MLIKSPWPLNHVFCTCLRTLGPHGPWGNRKPAWTSFPHMRQHTSGPAQSLGRGPARGTQRSLKKNYCSVPSPLSPPLQPPSRSMEFRGGYRRRLFQSSSRPLSSLLSLTQRRQGPAVPRGASLLAEPRHAHSLGVWSRFPLEHTRSRVHKSRKPRRSISLFFWAAARRVRQARTRGHPEHFLGVDRLVALRNHSSNY